jgi:hypothetical protein
MEYIPEQLNFRGNYRKYDANGKIIVYAVGDVVQFNDKKYIATVNLADSIPTSKNSGWKELEVGSRFYAQLNEPNDSNEGDRWFDLASGRLYTRLHDDNGYHWAEI